MSLTGIIRNAFIPRQHKLERHFTEPEALQHDVLQHLLHTAAGTEYGRNHLFGNTRSYDDFVRNVPVNTYEELKGDIDRMRHGESSILWPGTVKWYAKSSGTTNDKSKFIPVSSEGLHRIHYQGGTDVVALYLQNNPKSRMFDGKGLILGGSHSPNYNLSDSLVGDLSAILIENINPMVNLIRVPKKQTALLSDFEVKRDRIAHECLNKNVTNLSGVPSWMLSVLVRVLEISGKERIDEVWPNLEVFFHGGIAFTPYRPQYEHIIKSANMHYMETYNASEGFFGLQDRSDSDSMLLLLDCGIYYEFIPVEQIGEDNPKVVPLSEVEVGRNYAMLISTNAGLWRYTIGDTIAFTEKTPYRFKITGRTKNFINACGEEVIVDNAIKALNIACRETDSSVNEYTGAPLFDHAENKTRHQWVMEFGKAPADLHRFTEIFDKALQSVNSDYEAKRYKNLVLQMPQIISAPQGTFYKWLKNKGKLGGQH